MRGKRRKELERRFKDELHRPPTARVLRAMKRKGMDPLAAAYHVSTVDRQPLTVMTTRRPTVEELEREREETGSDVRVDEDAAPIIVT